MKKLKLLILIALIGFTKSFAATNDTLQLHKLPNRAFQSGEHLHYKVYYTDSILYMPAGEVTFDDNLETYNNKMCCHFKGFGKTYKSYDWFFKVKDLYESYVDTMTMLPIKFIRDVHEGGYRLYHNVTFKPEQHIAISTNGVYKVPVGIQDIMSAVFSIRNIDFKNLKIDEKVPFKIFIDDDIHRMFVGFLIKKSRNNLNDDLIGIISSYVTIKKDPKKVKTNIKRKTKKQKRQEPDTE